MHTRPLILAAALALAGAFTGGSLLAQDTFRVRVLASFDYPGEGNSTTPRGINDLGDVCGSFVDSAGVTRGFIRYADGSFSAPIVNPNDIGNLTIVTGINNLGHICGYYAGGTISLDQYAGFILIDSTYHEYQSSEVSIYITGLDDADDYCFFFVEFGDISTGEVSNVDGGFGSTFVIGDHTEANAINQHVAVAGNYTDNIGGVHGFLREPQTIDTTLRYPVDYPGAKETHLLGLSHGGRVVVGRYVNPGGDTHGLLLERPATFTSYDYPGAVETSVNAINTHKAVAGDYTGTDGIHHGFIAKIINPR